MTSAAAPPPQVEHALSEKRILASIEHPFVVRLATYWHDAGNLYLLMEPLLGGELRTLLQRHGQRGLPEASARFYSANVAAALSYLHEQSVLYRDVCAENLMLDERGYLRLVDFGFAKVVHERTHTLCGTTDYIAPEVLRRTGHDHSADWWSLGVLTYEMLYGYTPFRADDPKQLLANILRSSPRFPCLSFGQQRVFVSELLVSSPTERLGGGFGGARAVRFHPWFRTIDWEALMRLKLPPPHVPALASPLDTHNFLEYHASDESPSEEALALEKGVSDEALAAALVRLGEYDDHALVGTQERVRPEAYAA